MSSFLVIDLVAAQTPERQILFADLNISIGTERVGLVGRNGSGKSTLLSIILGTVDPARGEIRRSGTIGILAQEWGGDVTLAQALGVSEKLAIVQRVLLGSGTADDIDAADWDLEPRIDTALAKVGLQGTTLDRKMGTFSGGERTRAGVARLLIEAPDVVLLDEPTNNLDADGCAAIHSLVDQWRGCVIVASHDRELLELMDRIVELTPVGVRIVTGGWSDFVELRAVEQAKTGSELEQAELALRAARRAAQRQREAKERRDRGGRAFGAKGSEPKILLGARAARAQNSGARARQVRERLVSEASIRAHEARARVEVLAPVTMRLPQSGVPSRATLLTLKDVTVDLGARRLGPWTLDLRGPERIVIAGPNGAGKTTLMRVAAGFRAPSCGTVRRAEGHIAMLDQHVSLLDPDQSILTNFHRLNPGLNVQAAHAACARFAFRNRDADRVVATLSGGERLRAGLACTLSGERPPWLLMLDEPTNHLDMESLELLEEALRDFAGALMVVSHNLSFTKALRIEREFKVDGIIP